MKSEVLRAGIRLKRRKTGGRMIARQTEVYDLDTGRLLPVLHATIELDINKVVTATVRLQIEDMEVIDED